MKIPNLVLLLISFAQFNVFATSDWSLPAGKSGPIIKREGHIIQYDHNCKVPYWVSYVVKSSDLIKNVSRTNDFRPDPELHGPQASLEDYRRSGYNRGHMARAGLFTRNKKVMSESFILSNIVPQDPYMNQSGAWRRVEDFEFESIKAFKKVQIISGPVLEENMQRIGKNEVCVPNYVFKVLYKDFPVPTAVAFIIPNYRTSKKFSEYAVTIDELEERTGIDFLPELKDSVERMVESQFDLNAWDESIHRNQ